MVGTRSQSPHCLQIADRLGRAPGQADWPVLRGLAAGIYAAVHRGCLAVKGSPVAVLGTHLDRFYPSQHRELQSAIGRSGLLLSERFPGETPRPCHFAARNRLMVAMASMALSVEFPERSGVFISARYAAELGCPVGVVPSDAGRRSARGSNTFCWGKPLLFLRLMRCWICLALVLCGQPRQVLCHRTQNRSRMPN